MKNSLSGMNDIASRTFHMKGFTLVELLIYTGISVIVGGLTVGTLLTVTRVNQNASATAEVSGQMNFVLQRLQQLVSESSNIDIDAGVTTSSVKLRMQDSAKDPTCISLVDGVIKLAEGPGSPNPNSCNSTTSDLTGSKVVVNTLNFKKMVQYPGHDTLSLDMTMAYNTSNPGSQVSRSLSSAIGRVSAATFDSNVIPGGTSYTIGQSGSPWQNVFVGDGSAANPSYTFANNTGAGLFRAGANIFGFSTDGAERMRIDASGNVGIGTATPTSPLTVAGAIRSTVGGFVFPDATTQITAASGGAWTLSNNFLYPTSTSYNVGIGTTAPNEKLTVNGVLSLSESASAPDATSGYGKLYATTVSEGNDSYTKLLLHADGIENSFIDSSSGGKTVTANGNATQSATQSKFGGKSAYFDGTGDYLTLADNVDLQMGTGNFTIDFWVRFAAGSIFHTIIDKGYTNAGGILIQTNNDASPKTRLYMGVSLCLTESVAASLNTWYHYAVVRSGSGTNNIVIYRDGVSVGQCTSTANINDSSSFGIGSKIATGEYPLNGYLDEVRISKGIARWTTAFTPPTGGYGISGLYYKDSLGNITPLTNF